MRLFTTFHQLNGHKVQPWELAVAVGNAIVNIALRGIYDRKKIVVINFSMSLVFIFTTYNTAGDFWKIN